MPVSAKERIAGISLDSVPNIIINSTLDFSSDLFFNFFSPFLVLKILTISDAYISISKGLTSQKKHGLIKNLIYSYGFKQVKKKTSGVVEKEIENDSTFSFKTFYGCKKLFSWLAFY